MENNGMANVNSNYMLSSDDAYLLAIEFNRNPIVDEEAAFDLYPSPSLADKSLLPPRPPVITIMGHVDHGKTTLLDTLRSASVASGEAGGITQHIGAFSVPVNSLVISNGPSVDTLGSITFLDTPGHAAFTAMRSRGAHSTDIIVLVVAADDGVMPQTREVIALAKQSELSGEGNIGLVVALNKMDKPGADPVVIKHALLAEGVELEEFGGDVPCVEVSGLTGMGLDKLVETLATLAEIKELRARVDGAAEGIVLESRVDKGRGAVATILVTNGTLSSGSHVVAGTTWARIRQMTDSTGNPVCSALPGTPVTVSGWKELPLAGDEVLEGKEHEVKTATRNRKRNLEMKALQADVECINEKRAEAREGATSTKAGLLHAVSCSSTSPQSSVKELRLIVKADVSGSVEAIVGSIEGIGNDLAKVRIIQANAGEPTAADVDVAKAVDGMILGFSVQPNNKVLSYASSQGVLIQCNSIIYRIIDLVRSKVQELLPPIVEYRVLGEALVQQLFQIHGKQKSIISVAGCRVTNGIIEKHKKIRIIRGEREVYNGSLDTLKQLKKDITEVRKGSECGMSFTNFAGFKDGDRIQTYDVIEKPGRLV
ncbi:initiation factor 2 [Cantharellus anzutake]|uniref:initiation factor 2 n=1 Tax=Cantharellus anzutake TaxID=1750568 RepID=UPI0019034C50|nr:initiation factor 2 [Cantharellus anzutake]KAF8312728.1 initiation factor 2 [Cantharellus anzutake]